MWAGEQAAIWEVQKARQRPGVERPQDKLTASGYGTLDLQVIGRKGGKWLTMYCCKWKDAENDARALIGQGYSDVRIVTA